MNLKPSNIFYSQNDITERFRRKSAHGKRLIGETLDDLYYGRTSISNIPEISVVKKDGKWFTLDNRRLWIFHHLEGAGKLDTIHVSVETEISSGKYSTKNGGVSVKIYCDRDPGGKCRKYITPVTPRVPESDILDSPECSDETAIKPVEDLPSIIPDTNISVGHDIVPSTLLESSDTHDILAEPAIDENGNTHEVLTPDSQTEQNTENEIKAIQASNEEECEQHATSQETAKKPVVDLPAVILDTTISVGNDIVPSTHESSDKHDIKAEPAMDENGLSILGNTHEVLKLDIQTEENTEFERQAIQASNEEEYEQHVVSHETDSLSLKSTVCGSTENVGFDNSDKDGDISGSVKGNVICNGTRGIKRSVSSLGENEDDAGEGKRVKLD